MHPVKFSDVSLMSAEKKNKKKNIGTNVVENRSGALTQISWSTLVSIVVTNLYYLSEYYLFA